MYVYGVFETWTTFCRSVGLYVTVAIRTAEFVGNSKYMYFRNILFRKWCVFAHGVVLKPVSDYCLFFSFVQLEVLHHELLIKNFANLSRRRERCYSKDDVRKTAMQRTSDITCWIAQAV